MTNQGCNDDESGCGFAAGCAAACILGLAAITWTYTSISRAYSVRDQEPDARPTAIEQTTQEEFERIREPSPEKIIRPDRAVSRRDYEDFIQTGDGKYQFSKREGNEETIIEVDNSSGSPKVTSIKERRHKNNTIELVSRFDASTSKVDLDNLLDSAIDDNGHLASMSQRLREALLNKEDNGIDYTTEIGEAGGKYVAVGNYMGYQFELLADKGDKSIESLRIWEFVEKDSDGRNIIFDHVRFDSRPGGKISKLYERALVDALEERGLE